MGTQYMFRVVLTGFDHSCAREVKEALSRHVTGAGNARLAEILRQVAGGDRVVVYQSNSRQDAEDAAAALGRAGGEAVVER